MRVKGRSINKTKEEDIRYLFRHLKSENQKNKKARFLSDNKFYAKVAVILHISLSSVRRVFSKKDESHSKDKRHYKYIIDEFDRDLIRNVIYDFYAQKKLPTARMIMDRISTDIDISMFVL